jgi:hypothetical protein
LWFAIGGGGGTEDGVSLGVDELVNDVFPHGELPNVPGDIRKQAAVRAFEVEFAVERLLHEPLALTNRTRSAGVCGAAPSTVSIEIVVSWPSCQSLNLFANGNS